MKLPSRIGLSSVLPVALAAALVSCQTPQPDPPPPPETPAAGSSGGGAGGTSGGGGGATAGSAGNAGSPGSGGAAGGSAGSPGSGGAAGGGAGSPGSGGASGAGGNAPVDAPPAPPSGADAPSAPDGPPSTPTPQPMTACDYTPKANATEIQLRFEQIQMMGVPVNDVSKANGSLDGVTEIKFIPGKGLEFLLLQKRGRVSHLRLENADATTATLVKTHNLSGVNTTQDCGAISMAFDPDFANNKLMYFGYCTGSRASKLMRYTFDGNTLSDPVQIMDWDGTGGGNAWHSIGSIGFEKNGYLWVLHGEFNNDPRGQDLNTNLGKLLRIIPNREAGRGGFTVPSDNPFAMDANLKKAAIYSIGLRSPWKGNYDAKGRWIFGDVGNTTNEEINVVTDRQQNFGWATQSGPCSGQCRAPLTYWRRVRNDCVDDYCGQDAVKETRAGRAVWVGVQYGDCGSDRYRGALTGVQLFGDFFTGWVRGLVLDDAARAAKDASLVPLNRGHGGITAMAQGPDGFIYVGTLGPYDAAMAERPGLWRARPVN
jgi:glucose/arabinose dehydrogenase